MPEAADFPAAEFDERYRKAWKLMAEHGLAALLVTSEPNYRYFTGHRTQFWVGNVRPMYAVLPEGRPPVAIMAGGEEATFRNTSWVEDARPYFGFADESIDVLVEVLRELGLDGRRIGVDYGLEMRLGMPIPTFEKLQTLVPGTAFVDGSPTLWALRLFKSPAEVAYKRRAMAIADAGFERCWREVRPGMTEQEIQKHMAIGMVEAGAHHIGWLPVATGLRDYRFSQEPTTRQVEPGDIVWIDAGCTYHGYWSDVNRVCVVESASPEQKDAYRKNRELTRRCVEAIRPGLPISEIVGVWERAATELGIPEDFKRFGRLGHGSGIQMLEPPSIWSHDDTVLQPGMVIHVEPKTFLPCGCFQGEEAVVVTEDGSEHVTVQAPAELPITGER